jgi:hypothetical protein
MDVTFELLNCKKSGKPLSSELAVGFGPIKWAVGFVSARKKGKAPFSLFCQSRYSGRSKDNL